MTAPPHRPPTRADLDALAGLDDDAFWAAIEEFGYHRPDPVDPDQAWFWTRSWVTGELESDLDHAEGRTTFYGSGEEFLAALEERSRAIDAHLRGA
jgi:hypothetical protein